jgi:hypothetical protein
MKKKIHAPGQPLKTPRVPARKKAKIHKSHKASGKDYFGARPVLKELERL